VTQLVCFKKTDLRKTIIRKKTVKKRVCGHTRKSGGKGKKTGEESAKELVVRLENENMTAK